MSTSYDVWADPELRALVESDPELVAIADALREAAPAATAKPRRRRASHLAVIAAAAAALATLVLVAPWNRSQGTLADEALAALGTQPVLHVIGESSTGRELVDIKTGAVTPVVQQEEIWFDADKGLRRDVTRIGSSIVDDLLETPRGGFMPRGIVYDCTWIAAHPVEATKARVSCNASGQNGTTPHLVPRPKPTLDPGLAGFADGYQQALSSGQAREDSSGTVDGKPVDWLAFTTSNGRERVALDQASHKPVLLENDSGWKLRITTIETTSYNATDFARPTPSEVPLTPSKGEAVDRQTLPLQGAAIGTAVAHAVWAGANVAGLPLVKALPQTLTASFNGSAPAENGIGLELDYGSLDPRGRLDYSKPYVQLLEAPSRDLATAYKWDFTTRTDPAPGSILIYVSASPSALHIGLTKINGLYVTTQASTDALVLEAARTLQRASG